jgi:gamma-glutamyl hercynylcysteine S-oxide synthase
MESIVTEKIREDSQILREDDRLGYYKLAKHLLSYILNKKFPISVGIYGKWGSGKSVLANFLQEIAGRRNRIMEKRKKGDHNKIHFINFDAALFAHSNSSVFKYLAGKILAKVAENKFKNEGYFEKLRLLSKIFGVTKYGKSIKKLSDDQLVEEILFQKIKKQIPEGVYFVAIDNLDRLTPKETVNFLEKMKYFLLRNSNSELDNFVFIILCDFSVLENEVRSIYKNLNIDTRDYLNKLIEVPFYLPSLKQELSGNLIKSFLNNEISEEIKDNICGVISSAKIHTPRDIKMFLLELDMIYIIAKARKIQNEEYLIRNLDKILTVQIMRSKYPDILEFIINKRESLEKGDYDYMVYAFELNKSLRPTEALRNRDDFMRLGLKFANDNLEQGFYITFEMLQKGNIFIKEENSRSVKLSPEFNNILEIVDSATNIDKRIQIVLEDSVSLKDDIKTEVE